MDQWAVRDGEEVQRKKVESRNKLRLWWKEERCVSREAM